jgi:hypothetical protein
MTKGVPRGTRGPEEVMLTYVAFQGTEDHVRTYDKNSNRLTKAEQ